MQKRIFITGAAGFIGSHLALALQKRGDLVLGFDNFNDYYDPHLKVARCEHLADEGIEVLKGDICDFPRLMQEVQLFDPTHFVHLAAQAGVRNSIINPQAYVRSNLDGFLNVLEICRQKPSMPLIYASSSSVYGLNQNLPYKETDPVEKPASFYAATKRSNELMAFSYHHLFGISTTALRFFTVYGPWGRPDMAYFLFADAILKDKPIPIFNEGMLQRDFTYIDDIIAGCLAAIDKTFGYEIFNLGNHKPVEVRHLITLLENNLQKKAEKEFLPMQPGDVEATFADIEKSQKMLGFFPKTSLEDGIHQFVEWFKMWVKR